MSTSGAGTQTPENKSTPKPSASENSVTVPVGEVKKRVYPFQGLEIVEANKETIERIKQCVDTALEKIQKGSLRKDVYLGLFTTLLGLALGGCPDTFLMFTSRAFTWAGVLPFLYMLVAIFMLLLYFRAREAENMLVDSAIETIKQIQKEVTSIYRNSALPANEFSSLAASSQVDNHFARPDKNSKD